LCLPGRKRSFPRDAKEKGGKEGGRPNCLGEKKGGGKEREVSAYGKKGNSLIGGRKKGKRERSAVYPGERKEDS